MQHLDPDPHERAENPDEHTFVKARDMPTKTIYKCDGSCGQTNCQQRRTVPKAW